MSAQPLTHHEILSLVAPFARQGRQIDLAASDRLQRRLNFRVREHAADDGLPPLKEALTLEDLGRGWRLTRTLARPDGLQAQFVIDGPAPDVLLARLATVPPTRQFTQVDGITIAYGHHAVVPRHATLGTASSAAAAASDDSTLLLTHAQARLDGIALSMRVPRVSGIPAELTLAPDAAAGVTLPDDLLEVLGWDWTRLTARKDDWVSDLKLKGAGAARSRDAETKLARTVGHIARTLGESPEHFHRRQVRARWAVSFRRSLPLLGGMVLLAGVAAIPKFDLDQNALVRMMMFQGPPLLLVAMFCMRELPRFELPRFPRRHSVSSWRRAAAPAGPGAALASASASTPAAPRDAAASAVPPSDRR